MSCLKGNQTHVAIVCKTELPKEQEYHEYLHSYNTSRTSLYVCKIIEVLQLSVKVRVLSLNSRKVWQKELVQVINRLR